ncbi:MAG: hypothetical protein WC872_01985 [Candidatus Absconditabacterales bacterium]
MKKIQDLEKRINKRLLNFIIGGSALGDGGSQFLEKIKTICLDIYKHILNEYQNFLKRWRN